MPTTSLPGEMQAGPGPRSTLMARVLFTVGALLVYRLGCQIPLPGLDAEVLSRLDAGPARNVLSIFALGVTGPAYARIKIGGVYVYSERISTQGASCGLSSDSAVAAVESTLRANRIELFSKSDNRRFKEFSAYVNLTAQPIPRGCGVSWQLTFSIYGETTYGPSKVSLFGPINELVPLIRTVWQRS